MNSEAMRRLRVACNQFYLNKCMDQPLMSDYEFDELRSQYESEYGSIRTLVDWDSDLRLLNEPMAGLSKDQVVDNNLERAVNRWIETNQVEGYLNYKYDGSSLKIYYKNGRLEKILSTPDEKYGLVRTRAFWDLVPHEVDPAIASIQGEVLVDAAVYGELARNKANGLTNSKNMDDEVRNEAFIRVYKVNFVDGEWSIDRNIKALESLPIIRQERLRKVVFNYGKEYQYIDRDSVPDQVFMPALRFTPNHCPKTAVVEDPLEPRFQVDGVVLYSDRQIKGFKFYFTQSATTTIRNIAWQYQSNGGWMPKLQFDTVVINDKRISQAASGGVPNLMAMKMGVGAKVVVILSNMTIPKIIKVLEPSEEYNFPKCQCGYQTTPKDVVGSTVKCNNHEVCTKRVSDRLNRLLNFYEEWSGSKENYIAYHIHSLINTIFCIDRWDASKYAKKSEEEISSKLIRLFKQGPTLPEFEVFMECSYNIYGNARVLFNSNVLVAYTILTEFIKIKIE